MDMPRNITSAGRRRSGEEQLFTAALIEQLDQEQDRRGLTQRGLAELLEVHESLLSLYRSGQRLPSIASFIDMQQVLPGLLLRCVLRYEQLVREQGRPDGDPDTGRPSPPAERVGAYPVEAELLAV